MTTRMVRGRKWTRRSRSAGTACSIATPSDDRFSVVSLRGRTIEKTATLPDGRSVTVHDGVPEDPYIPRGELETVDVELHSGGRVLAAVNTVLDPDQEGEAADLIAAMAAGGLDGEAIRNVRVLERFSLLSVPRAEAERIVEAVNGTPIDGTRLRIEIARG